MAIDNHPGKPMQSCDPQVSSDLKMSEPEPESNTPSLWDEAYDLLKEEKPELLADYEYLLSRVDVECM